MTAKTVDAVELLRTAKLIVLIDWPSRDVPDTLARSGFTVLSDEGPDRGYTGYEANGDVVERRPDLEAPEQADIVYAHRPIEELPDIVEQAVAMQARAVWLQSGRDSAGNRDPHGCLLSAEDSRRAREIVESAGLVFVDEPYIADVARGLG